MTTAKLMTNILAPYYSFIEKEAKRSKRSKREVIEEAIALYIKEVKRQKIMEEYKSMEKDEDYLNEMVESAEIGMDYYLNDIDED